MPRYEEDDDDERPRRSRRRDDDEEDDPPRRRRRDDEDDDDRPRSRSQSRYDEDEDDRPRRRRREPEGNPAAGTSLTLGLLSILLNLITGIPAIIFGIIGIKKAGQYGPGKGMAYAGIASAVVGSIISAVGIYFFWNMWSENQAQNRAQNNVKQLGLAMHAHHDVWNRLPAAYTAPPGLRLPGEQPAPMEQRLTSWRVSVLPFIEQENLFRQYDQQQPWNSPRNQPVTSAVVMTYLSTAEKSNETRFSVFTGPKTPFRHGQEPPRFHTITDGLSNTIFIAESAELRPWGEPKDMELPPFGPAPPLGDPAKRTFFVLMGDGSIRNVRQGIDDRTLRLLIDPADGNPVPFDW